MTDDRWLPRQHAEVDQSQLPARAGVEAGMRRLLALVAVAALVAGCAGASSQSPAEDSVTGGASSSDPDGVGRSDGGEAAVPAVVGATPDEEAAIRPVLALLPESTTILEVELADLDGGRGLSIVLPDLVHGASTEACWEAQLVFHDLVQALGPGLSSATIVGEAGRYQYCQPQRVAAYVGDRAALEAAVRRRAEDAGFDLWALDVFGSDWAAVRAFVRLREDQLLATFDGGFQNVLFSDVANALPENPYAYLVVVEAPDGRGLHSWWQIPLAPTPGEGLSSQSLSGGDWQDVGARPDGSRAGATLELDVHFERHPPDAEKHDFPVRCGGGSGEPPRNPDVCAAILADPWPLLLPVEIAPYHGETIDAVAITGTLDGRPVARRYSNTGYAGTLARWRRLFDLEPLPGPESVPTIEPPNFLEQPSDDGAAPPASAPPPPAAEPTPPAPPPGE